MQRCPSVRPVPTSSRRRRPWLGIVASASCSAALAGGVPAAFHGTWVPAKGACDSPLRLLVGAERLTLENRGERESLGGIEMAGPGYFAPGYSGIMAAMPLTKTLTCATALVATLGR